MEELSDAERQIVSNAQAGVPTLLEQSSRPKVRASVVRELCLNKHWKLTPKGVEIHEATLTGALDLNWVTLTCPLVFENCTFDCAVSAADSVVPTLSFRDCQLKGLDAPRIQTKGILDLAKLNCMGEVNLTDAKIGVDLSLRGAKLNSETGTALNANSITVGMSIHLSDGFMATGSVCLIFAKLGGQLVCRGGCFNHPVFSEYAIDAEHLTTGSHVILDANFKAHGTVNLQHAKIGGSLNCSSGTFGRHPLENALVCNYMTVNGNLNLSNTTMIGSLHLGYASAHVLRDDGSSWPQSLELDGFKYDAFHPLSTMAVADRLGWLRRQNVFAPSSYEQLAKIYRDVGDSKSARKVLIAKYNDKPTPWLAKPWKWFLRLTIGYGYSPWLALIPTIVFVTVGWFFFCMAAEKNLMTPTRQVPGYKITSSACDPDVYPCFEPLMYTLDVFLPIVNLRQQEFWLPNSRDGFWYAVFMWCLILVGWVLTTTVVIGFNNQFRRE